MGNQRNGRKALLALIEAVEARVLFSSVDPAISAYQSRASQVISSNIASLESWASAQTGTDNLSTGGYSEWTASAAFSQYGTNQTAVNDGYLLLGSLMEYRTTHLFSGGNDGWEAWATADTYLRYRSVIDADTARYAPSGYATNPNSTDGKYSLDDLCKIVLTKSFYGPVDSTSNHYLTNATACYLANQAFPGQVVQNFNNETSDPTGANTLLSRAESLFADGPSEYGSINYGGVNWEEFLSVFQLTQSGNATLVAASKQAFETALAMNVAYWMNGQMAMPTARGYPTTGAWGASEGDTLDYVYVGGNYGQSAQQIAYADATDVKTTAVLAAEAQNINSYIPPAGILHLADSTTHITESNYGGNHQYAYDTEQWSTYSESWKYDAHGPYQSSWRARTIWTKPQDQTYGATAWVTEPSTNPTANSDGSYNYVNPYTLQAYPTPGSGSYQDSVFEDVSQYQNTQLHVYNIPPVSQEGTPGGQLPVRGAMVYLPIPVVTSTGKQAANGSEWMAPVLSADGHYLFVGYNSCFMAFISSAPFSLGTMVGNSQFYNVFGGPVAGQQVNQSQFIQCAVAQEVFSPSSFPGTTLAEQFTNFENTLMSRQIPKMTVADTYHPTWQYSNGQNTLTNEYVGVTHDNPSNNPGLGEDYIGGPGNSNPQVVDYSKWPMLYEKDLSGNVWANMPQNGNLTVTAPGQTAVDYDLADYVTSTGGNIGLTALSNTGGQISLSWNGGLGASSFTVARSTDDVHWTTLTSTLAASATSYTDSGLTQGQNYDYIVTPNGASIGASEPVGTAAIFNVPTNFKLTATTATSATVSWTNNSTGNSGLQLQYSIDGYSNQWRYWSNLSSTSTSTTPNLTNTSSFLDTAPTPQNPTDSNNRVFFRVVAYSTTANGTDIYSQPTNIVGSEFSSTYAGDLVSMPYGLAATSTSPTQVAINWTNTATTLSAYRVERSTNDTNWAVLTASLAPTATTYTDQTVKANQTYYYRVAAVNGTTLSPYSQVITVLTANPNQAPTVARAASASLVGASEAVLSVLGADDGGQSNLIYNWSVTAGPGSATFSDNDDNTAQNATATFDRAGTYTLTATAFDQQGLSVTSSATIAITQTLSALSITPTMGRLSAGQTEQLTATTLDQFGNAMSPQPTISWTATSGTVASSGLFTAPATTALSVVTASVGSLYASADLSTLAITAPLANYSFEDGSGTTAADTSGNGFNATLSGSVSFAQGITVGGAQTGGLAFTDGSASIGNPSALNFSGAITMSAWVKPTSTSGNLSIVDHGYTSNPDAEDFLRINGGSYQVGSWNGNNYYVSSTVPSGDLNNWVFLTGVYDPSQSKWLLYRNGVLATSGSSSVGAVTVNGNWAIGSTGIDNRNFTGSIDEVRLYNTALSATAVAQLYDSYAGPSFSTPATLVALSGSSAKLTALGSYAGGENTLKYTWYDIGSPPGTATFSDNGDNTAKNVTASFSKAGLYHLLLITSDANGNSAASELDVNVLPAWLSSTSQATWNPANNTLSVTGPSTIIADPGSAEPNILASGATASVSFNPTTGTATDFHIGGLALANGATVDVTSLAGNSTTVDSEINNGDDLFTSHGTSHDVLVVGSANQSTVPAFSIDTTSTLNLEDNDLIIHQGAPEQTDGQGNVLYDSQDNPLNGGDYPAIQTDLTNGRGSASLQNKIFESWNGASGIISSVASESNAYDGSEVYDLGFARDADIQASRFPLRSWTSGGNTEPLSGDGNDIIVKFTYAGDFNLDGQVNSTDTLIQEGGYQSTDTTSGAQWAYGDQLYNGNVNASDTLAFEGDYLNGTSNGGYSDLL